MCGEKVVKLKKNRFNWEVKRTCETSVDQTSQKKTYSTDINNIKKEPANEYYQMLPFYIGEYAPKQNIIDFESAREILMIEHYRKVVMKRRCEKI